MIVRIIKQSNLLRCPHVIFAIEHYRDDGTCKCDDPKETIMSEWGYRWDDKQRLWVYDKAV